MESLLHRPVLVLNRYWQPVHSCSARRALKLLCLGHAEVIAVSPEKAFSTHDLRSWLQWSEAAEGIGFVHSARYRVGVPEVITLTGYDRLPRRVVKLTRRNVFLRDDFTCQYCAKPFRESDLNLDHVMPRDKGGRMSWENIVTSCIRCNTRKANKLPHEANMHPLKAPRRPRWTPDFGLRRDEDAPLEIWRHFVPLQETKRSA